MVDAACVIALEAEALEDRVLLTVADDLQAALIADQAEVVGFLATQDLLRIGDSPIDPIFDGVDLADDMARLALLGYVPSHGAGLFEGQGLAFVRFIALVPGTPTMQLGTPDLITYKPVRDLSQAEATDILFDPPYELAGWGYAANYDPTDIPALPGFPEDVFFVHEAGFHTPDGGFTPGPPDEDHHGSEPHESPTGGEIGVPHQRFWDVHVFVNPGGGAPRTGIVSPFETIPGFPSSNDSFFFPEIPFGGAPRPIEDRIEAEDFDHASGYGFDDLTAGNPSGEYRVTDVDIIRSTAASNSFAVATIQAGEFLQYTVDVDADEAGEYHLGLQMRDVLAPGAVFRIEVDGADQTGPIQIPALGAAFNHFCPPETLLLTAGEHQIRLVFDENNSTGRVGQLDFIELHESVDRTINGDANAANPNDTITLVRSLGDATMLNVFINRAITATPNLSVKLASVGRLNIQGLSGSDTLVFDTRNGAIRVPGIVDFDGGTGTDQVTFSDALAALPKRYVLGGTATAPTAEGSLSGPLEYTQLEAISINAAGSIDTFRIDRLPTATSLTANGNAGNDEFVVGGGDYDSFIDGPLTMNGGAGTNSLTIDDTLDVGTDIYTITSTTFTKPDSGTLTWSAIASLVLNASHSESTIHVNGVAAATPLTVNANGGDDTIRVGGGDFDSLIDGPVTANGGAGVDRLHIDDLTDALADSYALTSTTFTKPSLGTGSVTYSSISGITLDANNFGSTIDVLSLVSALTVRGNGGNDQFNIGGGDFDTLIDESIIVEGGAGANTLTIDDRNDTLADDYTIGAALFSKSSSSAAVKLLDVSQFVLQANNSGNTIEILAAAGQFQAVSVFANGGSDTVIGGGTPELIDGGAGNDLLFGNDGNDTFVGGTGTDKALGGNGNDTADATVEFFDGGPGTDGVTIEGTAQSDRIHVDRIVRDGVAFLAATLNGVTIEIEYTAGETVRIEAGDGHDRVTTGDDAGANWRMEFFGGRGQDVLWGGDRDDVLDGGPGNDRLHGRGGDDELDGGNGDDLLDGGAGHDRLRGGADGDLLFGGEGDDQLEGGSGFDIFVPGVGADRIRARDDETDLIFSDADDLLDEIDRFDIVPSRRGLLLLWGRLLSDLQEQLHGLD